MLATGLMLMAFLTLVCSLIFDTVTIGRREVKQLHSLSIPLFELPPLARITAPADAAIPHSRCHQKRPTWQQA